MIKKIDDLGAEISELNENIVIFFKALFKIEIKELKIKNIEIKEKLSSEKSALETRCDSLDTELSEKNKLIEERDERLRNLETSAAKLEQEIVI